MAKVSYVGISSKARRVKKLFVGINGKARKVKKAYIGVGGKARLFFISGIDTGLWVTNSERYKDAATNTYKNRIYLGKVNVSTLERVTSVILEDVWGTVNGSLAGQVVAGMSGKMYAFRGSTKTIWEIDPMTMAYIRDTGIVSYTGYYGKPWARSIAGDNNVLYVSNMCRGNMGYKNPMFTKYDPVTGSELSRSGQMKHWIVGNGKAGQFCAGVTVNGDDYDEDHIAIIDGNTFGILVPMIGNMENTIGSSGCCCYYNNRYYMHTWWSPGPGAIRTFDESALTVIASKTASNKDSIMHNFTTVS